jgi:hypothetical protein
VSPREGGAARPAAPTSDGVDGRQPINKVSLAVAADTLDARSTAGWRDD